MYNEVVRKDWFFWENVKNNLFVRNVAMNQQNGWENVQAVKNGIL